MMKLSAILSTLSIALVSANIIFKPVPLRCDINVVGPVEGLTGCLRGQVCTEEGL